MKKQLFLLLTVMAFCHTYSQRLTVNDMITLTKCETFGGFNNFVINKGFVYEKTVNDTTLGKRFVFGSVNYTDTIDGYRYGTQAQFFIGIGSMNGQRMVMFETVSNKKYSDILNQLAAKGFAPTGKELTEENWIEQNYSSPKANGISIKIIITTKNDEERDYTKYSISIWRKLY